MKRLLNILIIILTIALLYVLIYPQYQEGRVYQLKIGTDKSVNPLILFLAEEKGVLKEQRLNPSYFYSESPDSLYDKLLAQEIDLACLPWSTVLKRTAEKGEKVLAFASQEFRAGIPVDAILTNPLSKITAFSHLKGKRLGFPPALRHVIPFVLSDNGIPAQDVKLTEISQAEIAQGLVAGELDAAIVWEPYRTELINRGMKVLLDAPLPKSIISPYPGFVYAITPHFLKERRKVAVRLKIATDMAMSLVDKEPQVARNVLVERLHLSPELVANFNLPGFQKLAAIDKPGINSYLSYLGERGVINKETAKGLKAEDVLTQPADLQP